jgi:cell division transport system ATP-binding protein
MQITGKTKTRQADSYSEMTADPFLELKEVSKTFDDNDLTLNRVSFRMQKGQFLFLVGPNGSGKTTLLKLIAAEESPSSGEIHVDGIDVRRMDRRETLLLKQKMGRVFQDLKLIKEMDVFNNVALSLRILGKSERRVKDKVFQALGFLGLSGKSRFFPAQLSSAEKQKVALARAVAKDPVLLLVDEPTSNLDDQGKEEMMNLIKKINLMGTAILFATKDMSLCRDDSVKVMKMEKGRLV